MSEESNIFSIKAEKIKYSRYGNNLERLFKNSSLDYLQTKLKNPKYFKPKEEKIDDFFSKQKQLLNMDKIASEIYDKRANTDLNKKEDKKKKKKKNDDPNRELTFNELIKKTREMRLKREKELKNEQPDMWKYNPNYNLRFINNPRVILPPIDLPKKKTKELEEPALLMPHSNIENFEDEFDNEPIVKNEQVIEAKVEKIKEESPKKEIFSTKNKALKFENYTSRKELKIPLTNNIEFFTTEPK